jgi:chromate reductase, NAD(P)H dehydrogenase (quinone)
VAITSIRRALAEGRKEFGRALTRVAPEHFTFTEIPIGGLPLYSYDFDADYPPVAKAFIEAAAEAVLFVTPEYNRPIPGALKNAIDWASRPYGLNSFARKSSAVIGTSLGAIGTAVGMWKV